ncbi:hypothetical protein ACWWT1_004857, partial [Escherichia coli]
TDILPKKLNPFTTEISNNKKNNQYQYLHANFTHNSTYLRNRRQSVLLRACMTNLLPVNSYAT